MRVFGGFGKRGEFDFIAADFPRDGRKIRRRGDDVQFGVRGEQGSRGQEDGDYFFHGLTFG